MTRQAVTGLSGLGWCLLGAAVLLAGCSSATNGKRPTSVEKSPPAAPSARPTLMPATVCWGSITVSEVGELSGIAVTLLVDDRSCVFRDSNDEYTLSISRDPSVSKESDQNQRLYADGLVQRPGHVVRRPAGSARSVIDIDIDSATGQGLSSPASGGFCSVHYVRERSSSPGVRAPFSTSEVRNALQLVTHALNVCAERPPPKL